MTAISDEQLILQAQSGQSEAFGLLVQRYQTAVFNVAYRMFGQAPDAEDATQEAFVRAYKAIERFDSKRPFAPWIKRITVNVCLNVLESKQNQTQTVATDIKRDDQTQGDMDDWQHRNPTPEQNLVKQERDILLREAILTLPPNYRAVLEYRHFQELTYDQIAETMNRPVSSVKSDLFRARKMLATRMKEERRETRVESGK
ncbi:MAG: sigma-70 family RNA polymerase sigma factor [Chloroflexota bacterium]